jgi:ABC-2 type transport system ATP-binding protein
VIVETVLSVRNLKKSFRKTLSGKPVQALKGVSFDVKAGSITGFLGANGAGKTTTIKCLLGLALPDEGEVRFFGSPELTPESKRRIGFLPERPYFYEYLSGREFLKFYGQLSSDMKAGDLKVRVDELLKRVGLEHAGDRALRGYSKGMLQRVGIAQALVHRPDFIILDEPMTGLDPDGRFEVREIIRETAGEGTAVFFSSHLLPDAEQLCQRLVILKTGDLVFQGPTKDLLTQVDSGFELTTARDGKMESKQIQGLQDLQREIDRLRGEKSDIVEIKPVRLTLEEAFVKIAMQPRAGQSSNTSGVQK